MNHHQHFPDVPPANWFLFLLFAVPLLAAYILTAARPTKDEDGAL